MAGPDGDAGDHLSPHPEFFETVRDLLVRARQGGTAAGLIGDDVPPAREPVRLRATSGQRRHEEEVTRLGPDPAEPARTAVEVPFMGLTGPAGVLPDHYTERVVEGRRARDEGLADFLALFDHRALSLFWRAWAKYRIAVAFEADGGRLEDPFSRALAGLSGLGAAGEAIPDAALLRMAGPLARPVRSAGALRRLVATVHDLPVEVIELAGRWVPIGPDDRTRLSSGGADPGGFATLGGDAVAGTAVRDLSSRFVVRIGPLDGARFRAFFEEDGPRAAVTDTIRRAVGGTVDFAIQIVLARADVPAIRLDDPGRPARLGQTSWLLHGPADRDRDEALLPGRPG